ncbi:MAG: HAMP domain-containing histidine kinase [Thermoproteota archaeon]|nr:HAMP domain-containing histidine kinase [Thermoproteota archaeon]
MNISSMSSTKPSQNSENNTKKGKGTKKQGFKIFTKVYHGSKKADNELLQFIKRSKRKIDCCISSVGPSVIMEIGPIRKARIASVKEMGVKLRYVTEITPGNVEYCKEMITFSEIRHLDRIKGNFEVADEKEYVAFATLDKAQSMPQLIFSNVPEFVEQQQFVFDSFWEMGIPAEQRIREIEKGISPEFFKVVSNPDIAIDIFFNLAKSIQKEALLILPDNHAVKMMQRIGLLNRFVESVKSKNAKAKIIYQENKENKEILNDILLQYPEVSILPVSLSINSIIFLIDDKEFIKVEIKGVRSHDFRDSIGGFAIYSNSKLSINSFKSFFNIVWKQQQMEYDLRVLNKNLEESCRYMAMLNKMQKDFIDISTNELRKPSQAILIYAELALSDSQYREADEEIGYLGIILRNALRLNRLTQNMLNVIKIENKKLNLNKEIFGLEELIYDTISELQTKLKESNSKDIEIIFEKKFKNGMVEQYQSSKFQDFLVEADRDYIKQVVVNLIGNAIKYTDEKIIVRITKGEAEVTVNVIDFGQGIDQETMPDIFSKSTTKSNSKIGLGLFISKGIIEVHGGRIWAQNNNDGKGATFAFSLPLQEKH